MSVRRGLIVATLCVAASGQAWAATKCQGGGKTLYTEAASCPAGYTDVTRAMDGKLSTIGKADSVREQEQAILDARPKAAEAGGTSAQTVQPTDIAQAQQSRALVCGSIADQMRALETDMQQRHTRQSIEAASRQYRDLRDQQLQNQC